MLPMKIVFLLQYSLLTTVSFGKFEFTFGTAKRGHLNHQIEEVGGAWRFIVDIFVKIDIFVKTVIFVKIDIYVKLTFLSIAFDIFINIWYLCQLLEV